MPPVKWGACASIPGTELARSKLGRRGNDVIGGVKKQLNKLSLFARYEIGQLGLHVLDCGSLDPTVCQTISQGKLQGEPPLFAFNCRRHFPLCTCHANICATRSRFVTWPIPLKKAQTGKTKKKMFGKNSGRWKSTTWLTHICSVN